MDPASLERIEVQLTTLVDTLDRMNRRDRLRTIGGFFRSIMTILPVLLVLWSAWYFAQHSEEIMKKIIDQTTEAAAAKTSSMTFDELKQKYGLPSSFKLPGQK